MIRYRDLLSDTICSPVTPPGYSGVAVVRVSGDKAYDAVMGLMKKKDFQPESHKSYLSTFLDPDGHEIDQVLATFFEKGHSFTGDKTVEISCHGNPLIVNRLTKALLERGCRSAEKGEFSFRAYYNGKIDLVQAESIQSLVTTNVKVGSETFIDQLQGKLSKEFLELQDELVSAMAHLEASIDFVEQDIETAELSAVEKILGKSKLKADQLLKSYDVGKSLQKNLKVLILGNTNVGKSSLFNRCVDSERAIVTDVAGTTRDLVTEQKFLGNNSVEFIDSAGIRETKDKVENIGIQKSLDQVKQADLIFYVVDIEDPGTNDLLPALPVNKTILVLNKVDLLHSEQEKLNKKEALYKEFNLEFPVSQLLFVSSLTGEGISELLTKSEEIFTQDIKSSDEGAVVTQARHFNHLTEFDKYLSQSLRLIAQEESPDIISQELSLGLSEIHQLLGKEYDDEVLDKIFSEFCIGK